jgi:hypothetical protein
MPGPRKSLDDYIKDRLHQFGDLGGVLRQAVVNVLEGLDAATIHARVTLGESESGLLTAFELVVLTRDGTPHRAKYAYHCMYDGQFLFSYDRDSVQHPEMPEHKHLSGDRRIAAGRVTLQDVADEFWPMVVERDEERRRIEDDEPG